MRRRAIIPLMLLAAFFLVGCETPTPTPTPAGYTVAPAFEESYAQYGPTLLGAPITGVCLPGDGTVIQYFENVRLERTPEGVVQFHPLGQWALSGVRSRVSAQVPTDSPSRTFPETGYTVQDQFLSFYEENNGEQLLGPPLSEQLLEGDLRLQYFRNGRLEWRPEAPPEQRVRLGSLGRAHYQQNGGNGLQCDLLALFDATALPQQVNLSVQLEAPILFSTDDEQIVYVQATAPNGAVVSGVTIRVNVHYRGETIEVPLGETDQSGLAIGSLGHISFEPEEEVIVEVTAHNGDGVLLGRTTVSFTTWW